MDDVIGIDESDIFPFRNFQSGISGGPEASVFLMDDNYSVIFLFIFIANHRAVVGRAIVDEYYLKVFIRLGYYAVQTLLEIEIDIIDRHNDAD